MIHEIPGQANAGSPPKPIVNRNWSTINLYQSCLHLPRMHPSQRIYCTKSEKLKGKRIILGITGSIAAVEDVKLIREPIGHVAMFSSYPLQPSSLA